VEAWFKCRKKANGDKFKTLSQKVTVMSLSIHNYEI